MKTICDGADKCANDLAYTCGCSRCDREPEDEKFHTCTAHRDAADVKHLRIRGRVASWYFG